MPPRLLLTKFVLKEGTVTPSILHLELGLPYASHDLSFADKQMVVILQSEFHHLTFVERKALRAGRRDSVKDT